VSYNIFILALLDRVHQTDWYLLEHACCLWCAFLCWP